MRVTSSWRAAALAMAVCGLAGLLLALPAQAQTASTEAYYVDWLEANPVKGTARGVAKVPVQGQADQEIEVRFAVTSNDAAATPVSYNMAFTSCQSGIDKNGKFVSPVDYWSPVYPYLSSELTTRPPACDLLSLEGNLNTRYTVTLSSPVVKPLMAIMSLGNGNKQAIYSFDKEFRLLKPTDSRNGYWGGSYAHFQTQSGTTLKGKEGHGVVEFVQDEAMTTFSWTVPEPEYWHGFTFAFRLSAVQQQVRLCGDLPKTPASHFISQPATASSEGVFVTYQRTCPTVGFLPSTGTTKSVCKKIGAGAGGTYAWSAITEIPCTRVCAAEPLIPEGHYQVNAGSKTATEGATRSYQRDCGPDFLPSEISTIQCVSVISDAPLQWTPINPLVCTPAPRKCKEVPAIKEGEKYFIVAGGDDRSLGAKVSYRKECGRGYLPNDQTVTIECVEDRIPDKEIRESCHPVKWTEVDYEQIKCVEAPRECETLPTVPADYMQVINDNSEKVSNLKAEGSVLTFGRDCGKGFLATKETSSMTCVASSSAVDAYYSWTPLAPITCVRLCDAFNMPGDDYYIADDSDAGENLQGKTVTFRRNCGWDKIVPEETTSITCSSGGDVNQPLFWTEAPAIPCVDVPDVCPGAPVLPETYFEVSRQGGNQDSTKEGSIVTISRTCPYDYEIPSEKVTSTCVANRVAGQHTTWAWSKLSGEIICEPLPRECDGKPDAPSDYKIVSHFDNDEGYTIEYTRDCGWDFQLPTTTTSSTCIGTQTATRTTYAWSKIGTIECIPVEPKCAEPATAPETYSPTSDSDATAVGEGAIVSFKRECGIDFKVPTTTVSTTCLANRQPNAHTTWSWTPLDTIECEPVDPVCEGQPIAPESHYISSGADNRMEGQSVFFKRTCPIDFYEPETTVSSVCQATRVPGQWTTWAWSAVDTIPCQPMPRVCKGLPFAENDYSIQSVTNDENVDSVVTFTRNCGFDFHVPKETVSSTCEAHPTEGAHTTYSWSLIGSIRCIPVDPVCIGDPERPADYRFVSATDDKREGSVHTLNRVCPLDYQVPTKTVTATCEANRVVGQHTTWSWSKLSGDIECIPVPRECKGKPAAPADYRIVSAEEEGDADDDTDAEGFTVTFTRKCGWDYLVPTKTVSSTCEAISVSGEATTWAWSELDTIDCEPVPRVCEAPAAAPESYTPTADSGNPKAVAEGSSVTFTRDCGFDFKVPTTTVTTTCEATKKENAHTTWSWTPLDDIICIPVEPVCAGEPEAPESYSIQSGKGNNLEGTTITYQRDCGFDFRVPSETTSSTCEANRVAGQHTTWSWSKLGSIKCIPVDPVCEGKPNVPSGYKSLSTSNGNMEDSIITYTRTCGFDYLVPTSTVTAQCVANRVAGQHTTWAWSELSGSIECKPVPRECKGKPAAPSDYRIISAEEEGDADDDTDAEGFTVTYTRDCSWDYKIPTKTVSSTCEAIKTEGDTLWRWSELDTIECEEVPRVCEAPAVAPADYTAVTDASLVDEGSSVTFTRNCGIDFLVPTETVTTVCEANKRPNAHTTWSWSTLGSIPCVPVTPKCEGKPIMPATYYVVSGEDNIMEDTSITYSRKCPIDFYQPSTTVSSTCKATRVAGQHTTWAWTPLDDIICQPIPPVCAGKPDAPDDYPTISVSNANNVNSVVTFTRVCPLDHEVPSETVTSTCVAHPNVDADTTWSWSPLSGTIPCIHVPKECKGLPNVGTDYVETSAIDNDEGFTISYTRKCGWDFQVPTPAEDVTSTCEAHREEGVATKWLWSKVDEITCRPVPKQCAEPASAPEGYSPIKESNFRAVTQGTTVTFTRDCGFDFQVPTETVSTTCEANKQPNAHTTWSWSPLGSIECVPVPPVCAGEPHSDSDYSIVSGKGLTREGSVIVYERDCGFDFVKPTTTVSSTCEATRIPGTHTTWAWSKLDSIMCIPVDPICPGEPSTPESYFTQSISHANLEGSIRTYSRTCPIDHTVPETTVSSTCVANRVANQHTTWSWSQLDGSIPCIPVPRVCEGLPDSPKDYSPVSAFDNDEGFTITFTRNCGIDYKVPTETTSSTCEAHSGAGPNGNTQWLWSKLGEIKCIPVERECEGQPTPVSSAYFPISGAGSTAEGSIVTFSRKCSWDEMEPTETSSSKCEATSYPDAHTTWAWSAVGEIECPKVPRECDGEPQVDADYFMIEGGGNVAEGSVVTFGRQCPPDHHKPTTTVSTICQATSAPNQHTTWAWSPLDTIPCVPVDPKCDGNPNAPDEYSELSTTNGNWVGSVTTFTRRCLPDYLPSGTSSSTCEAYPTEGADTVWKWSEVPDTITCKHVPKKCRGKPEVKPVYKVTGIQGDEEDEEGTTITYTRDCGIDFKVPTPEEDVKSTCEAIKTKGAATKWLWSKVPEIECKPVPPVCAGQPSTSKDYTVVSVSDENKEGSVYTFTRECGADFYIPTVTTTSTCQATRSEGSHTSWSWTPVNEIACIPIPPVCNCLPEAGEEYRMVSTPLKQEGASIEYAYLQCKTGYIPKSTTFSTCKADRQPGVMTTWMWTPLVKPECVPINRECAGEPAAPAGYFELQRSAGKREGSEVTFSRACGFDYLVPSITASSICREMENGASFAWSPVDTVIPCVPVPPVCHGKPDAPADYEVASADDKNDEGFTITYTRKCGVDFEIPSETTSSTCKAIKTEGAATKWSWTPLGEIKCREVPRECKGEPAAPADYTIASGAGNTAEGSVIEYSRQCGLDYIKPTTTVSSTCKATKAEGQWTVFAWTPLDSIECKPVPHVCEGLPQAPATTQGTYTIQSEDVNNLEGSTVEFSRQCGPDFIETKETTKSTCQATRATGVATTWAWSSVAPIECVPVPAQCDGEPDAPDDYFQVSRSAENAEGSVAIYNRRCGVDYKVPTNTVSSTCQATRTEGAATTWAWTHVDDSIACVPLPGMCKGKPVVPNDFVVISAEAGEDGAEEGFTLTYTRQCGIDYQIPLGTASSRCEAISTAGAETTYAWTKVGRIKCLPVPAKCEGKPTLPDDSYFLDSVFSDSEGAVVEYSRECGFDYKAPTTTVTSTCEATRSAGVPTTWSWTPVPELECVPIPRVCTGMPRAATGYFIKEGTEVNNAEGSIITYQRKCGSGYDSTSTSTAICRVTSTQGVAPTFAWTVPAEIICPNVNTIKSCADPPATPAGFTITSGASNRESGKSIAYQRSGCSAYGAGATSATATITCNDGAWTALPESIDCVQSGPCDDIPIPANGAVAVDTSKKTQTVYTYSCNMGFKMTGQHDTYKCHHATMKLTPDDRQVHAMPTCEATHQTARRLLGFA